MRSRHFLLEDEAAACRRSNFIFHAGQFLESRIVIIDDCHRRHLSRRRSVAVMHG